MIKMFYFWKAIFSQKSIKFKSVYFILIFLLWLFEKNIGS